MNSFQLYNGTSLSCSMIIISVLLLAACAVAHRPSGHQEISAIRSTGNLDLQPRRWLSQDLSPVEDRDVIRAALLQGIPQKRFISMKGESNTRTGKRGQLQQFFGARSVPLDAWDIDLAHLGPAPPAWRRNEPLGKVKFVSGMPIMRYGRRK